MKKTYVQINEDSTELFALYTGIEEADGGWMLETNGGATCQNELEDAGAAGTLETIDRLLTDPSTPWEDCDERDEEYINGTLEAWGLK